MQRCKAIIHLYIVLMLLFLLLVTGLFSYYYVPIFVDM